MNTSRKVDRSLETQLERARDDTAVSAVFKVRTSRGQDPKEVDSLVRGIVAAAEVKSGAAPFGVAVFANLGSFSVTGPAALIRSILADRKVAAATAASRDEDVLIRPVHRKRTSLHDDKA